MAKKIASKRATRAAGGRVGATTAKRTSKPATDSRTRRPTTTKKRVFAGDGYSDLTTGRGFGNNRAGRSVGLGNRKTDLALLNLYRSNGGMQRVVNLLADDSTRKGFKIITDDPQDNLDIQKRWIELDLQAKYRDLIKYMQIYPQGSALFMAPLMNNPQAQRDFGKPMPSNILEIDFVNSLNHPGDFRVQSASTNDPTVREFHEVFFRVMGRLVDPSWMVWAVSEWDRKDNEGLSRVNTVFDAISAQDSALWSTSTMVQQLSFMIYTSNTYTKMSPGKKREFSAHVRNFLETGSFFGIKDGEKVERLDYQFSGLKDILDFIFQNVALYSQIPQNILLGRNQGILTAANEDAINYYAFINQFQSNRLERMQRKTIDTLLLERRGDLWKRHQGKLIYQMEYEPLWELSPTLKADIDLKRAQTNETRIRSGVMEPDEARALDPELSVLDTDQSLPDDDDDTNVKEKQAAGGKTEPTDKKAGDKVSFASKAKVSRWDDLLIFKFHSSQLIDDDTWEHIVLDGKKGITGSKGKLQETGEVRILDILFKGEQWTQAKAMTWIDFNIKANQVLSKGADKVSIAGKTKQRTFGDTRVFEFHPMSLIEMKTWDHVVLDGDKGITAVKAKLEETGELVFVEIAFEGKQWTSEKAMTWIDFNLPQILNSAAPDGDAIGLDEIENALRRGGAEFDELPMVGHAWRQPGAVIHRVTKLSEIDGDTRQLTISRKHKIYAAVGKMKGEDKIRVVDFRFPGKWRGKKAAKWIEDNGFETI